jgi:hypothetical protein
VSKQSPQDLTCPRCGVKSQAVIWDSINVTLDPEAKERIMDGSLFKHQCPSCQFSANVAYPCLYHDMDRNLMIYIVPDQDGTEEQREAIKAAYGNSPFPPEMLEGYILRIVESAYDLREKIGIFEASKDDRVIEMCKLLVGSDVTNERPDFKISQIYFEPGDEDRFIVFDLEGNTLDHPLPPELYLQIKRVFEPFWDRDPRGQFEIVDMGWAVSMLDKTDDVQGP